METVLMDTDRVFSITRQRWAVTYACGKVRKTYDVEADSFDGAKAKARIAMRSDPTRDELFRRVAKPDVVKRVL